MAAFALVLGRIRPVGGEAPAPPSRPSFRPKARGSLAACRRDGAWHAACLPPPGKPQRLSPLRLKTTSSGLAKPRGGNAGARPMKIVMAIIKPFKLEEVRDALTGLGV